MESFLLQSIYETKSCIVVAGLSDYRYFYSVLYSVLYFIQKQTDREGTRGWHVSLIAICSSSLPVRQATHRVFWSSSSLITWNVLQWSNWEVFNSLLLLMIRRRCCKKLSSSKGKNSLRPLLWCHYSLLTRRLQTTMANKRHITTGETGIGIFQNSLNIALTLCLEALCWHSCRRFLQATLRHKWQRLETSLTLRLF